MILSIGRIDVGEIRSDDDGWRMVWDVPCLMCAVEKCKHDCEHPGVIAFYNAAGQKDSSISGQITERKLDKEYGQFVIGRRPKPPTL